MPLVVVVLQQLSVTPTTITPQIIIIHRQRRPVYSERLWLESKESAGNVDIFKIIIIIKHKRHEEEYYACPNGAIGRAYQ
jgi:hypothetical protein